MSTATHLKELLADGWQRILVLNGHFENLAFLIEAADLLMREQKSAFPRVVITSWWDNISNDVLPKIFDEVEFAGWELEHAALVETSAMMLFAPELVNEELFLDEGLEALPRRPGAVLTPAGGAGEHPGAPLVVTFAQAGPLRGEVAGPARHWRAPRGLQLVFDFDSRRVGLHGKGGFPGGNRPAMGPSGVATTGATAWVRNSHRDVSGPQLPHSSLAATDHR